MATVSVELRTDLKCVSGSRAICDYSRFVSCKITEALDGNGGCTIVMPKALGDKAQLRYVLYTTDTVGFVREFRIREITYDPIAATATIDAAPVHADLATAGMIRDLVYGFAVSAVTLTPTQWIQNFILTNLVTDKLPWLSLGTIEAMAALSISFVGFTRLQLLRALESQSGAEFSLRRNGDTGYVIDLLTATGSAATPIRAVYGRNLIASSVQVQDDELATVVQPTGDTPSGGTGPATIEQNSWRVESYSGTGPYWVVLADPAGGAKPIAFDDQANPVSGALYVISNDGSSQLVLDSRASDGAIQVSSVAALPLDSHCTLARSATEVVMELDNPAASLVYGRTVRALPVSGVRGEKNLVANGGLEYGQGAWTMANISLANQSLFGFPVGRTELGVTSGLKNGAISASTITSIALDGLPANGWLRRFDKIEITPTDYVLTGSPALFNSSGDATVTFTPAAVSAISASASINRGTYVGTSSIIRDAVSIGATTAIIRHGQGGTPLFLTNDKVRVLRIPSAVRSYTDTFDITSNNFTREVTLSSALAALPGFYDKWNVTTIFASPTSGGATVEYTGKAAFFRTTDTIATLVITGMNGFTFQGGNNCTIKGIELQERVLTGTLNQFAATGTITQTLTSAFTGEEYTAGAGVMAWARSAGSLVAGHADNVIQNSAPVGIKYTSIVGTTITLDGLTPTSPIVRVAPVGATFGFNLTPMYVSAATQASAGGAATIPLISVAVPAIADNAAMSITRPVDYNDADGGGANVFRIDTAYNTTPLISTPAAAGPSAYVKVPAGGSVYLTASAALTLWNRGTAAQTVSGAVVLVNVTTNAVVGYGTTSPATFSLAAGTYYHATLRVSATITTSGTYEVRALGGMSTTGQYANVATYVRWVMLSTSPDANVPYVAGSHANKLWQLANLELGVASRTPQTLRAKLIDLKRLGVPVGTEAIAMGVSVVLENVNISGRIVSYTLDLAEPMNSEVTLSTAPKRITNFL